MNPYIQQKVEEIGIHNCLFASDYEPDEPVVPYERVKKLIEALQDTWNEATKTSNSGRKMYEIGRKEMLEEVMGCFGQSLFREEFLSNMKKKGLIK